MPLQGPVKRVAGKQDAGARHAILCLGCFFLGSLFTSYLLPAIAVHRVSNKVLSRTDHDGLVNVADLRAAVSSGGRKRLASKSLVATNDYSVDLDLAAILGKVGRNKEVLVAVSNSALISEDGKTGILKDWITSVTLAGVSNYLIIALDDQLAETLSSLGVAYWRKDPARVADGAATNHGISALKFQLIKEFLVLGYSVLLSDVDVATLQNPFMFLYRDADIEAMSDGFDGPTAYGYNDVFDDPSMGWSRYAHTMRVFCLNSGLFYVRPNIRTIRLMERITKRLTEKKEWDQAVFNEEIFFPSHDDYHASHIKVRVKNIDLFLNSKRLFKTLRFDPKYATHKPVMVHINYHPDKWPRLQAVIQRYHNHQEHALDQFPSGSS